MLCQQRHNGSEDFRNGSSRLFVWGGAPIFIFPLPALSQLNVPPQSVAAPCETLDGGCENWSPDPSPQPPNAHLTLITEALSAMEEALAEAVVAEQPPSRLETSEPVITQNSEFMTATSELLLGGDTLFAEGTSMVTVDLLRGDVDMTWTLTETGVTRDLVQSLWVQGDTVYTWGTLSADDGSDPLAGGWVWSQEDGLAVQPGSDPGFQDAVEAMLDLSGGAARASGDFLSTAVDVVVNVATVGVNYLLDVLVPYTPPISCVGPIVSDGAGQSCEDPPLACRQKLAEMCEEIANLPNVTTAFRKCMKGRCGCSGSNHKRARVSCADSDSCGPCVNAGGCNLAGGTQIWYCQPNADECECVDVVFHEMSHACGVGHSPQYMQNPSCQIPNEKACIIGKWFGDRCIPVSSPEPTNANAENE